MEYDDMINVVVGITLLAVIITFIVCLTIDSWLLVPLILIEPMVIPMIGMIIVDIIWFKKIESKN